jgi:hypothetical protein
MTYKYYRNESCLLTPMGFLELHLTARMCTNNNQKMLADSVKGSSVRMTMYVRVTECPVLLCIHSTYTICYTDFRFRVQESRV